MIRFGLFATVCLSTLTALVPLAGADAPHRPTNLSSHPPDFFRDLLGGRVFVYQHRNEPAAIYHAKDGTVVGCWYHSGRKRFVRAYQNTTWKIGTPRRKSNIEYRWTTPDTEEHHLRRVIIYTPSTGRFHFEAVDGQTRHWKVTRDGWIQEDWPQILVELCPALNLPYSLRINEYQDSASFGNVKANSTPIQDHPGSDIRFPGATGLGASKGQPTMSVKEVETVFQQSHRHLSTSISGHQIVIVSKGDHREVWNLDNSHNVLDVGIMRLASNGTLIKTQWEKSGRKSKFLVGYPLPGIPTNELHPVFAMMDELTSTQKAVPLPSITSRPLDHVFSSDGTVRTQHSAGTWHISHGDVHVAIDGAKNSYPWRDFAQRAGWTG